MGSTAQSAAQVAPGQASGTRTNRQMAAAKAGRGGKMRWLHPRCIAVDASYLFAFCSWSRSFLSAGTDGATPGATPELFKRLLMGSGPDSMNLAGVRSLSYMIQP